MTHRYRRGLAALAALVLSAAPLSLTGVASAATARPADGRPHPPATAPAEIGLDTLFTGVLNGQRGVDVLRTDCTGQLRPGQTGHPLAGQTVEVDQLTAGETGVTNWGFTGGAVLAIFTEPGWDTGGVSLPGFGDYFAPAPVPTSLTVPCSGTGTITFDPVPGGVVPPIPAKMTVTFASQP